MSAGVVVDCPHCGGSLALWLDPLRPASRDSDPGPRTSAVPPRSQPTASSQQPPELEVAFSDENGWEMKCPNHDWHAAREFPASGRDGAVIKCTGKTAGKWCDVRVPLEVARRRAGR